MESSAIVIASGVGETCPCCLREESTEHYAVLPLISDQFPEPVLPHAYSVCDSCHKRQVQAKLDGTQQSVIYGSYAAS